MSEMKDKVKEINKWLMSVSLEYPKMNKEERKKWDRDNMDLVILYITIGTILETRRCLNNEN